MQYEISKLDFKNVFFFINFIECLLFPIECSCLGLEIWVFLTFIGILIGLGMFIPYQIHFFDPSYISAILFLFLLKSKFLVATFVSTERKFDFAN